MGKTMVRHYFLGKTIFMMGALSLGVSPALSADKNAPLLSKPTTQSPITQSIAKIKSLTDDIKHYLHGSYTVLYENDLIGDGNDQNYTSGIRVAYTSPKNDVPRQLSTIIDYMPFVPAGMNRHYTIAVGQSIFTPQGDKKPERKLIKDDRPYAGWLYGTAGVVVDDENAYHTAEVTLGMVGPASGAEKMQNWIHKEITNSPTAEGWNHQLKNELGLNLNYATIHHWKNGVLPPLSPKLSPLEWDILPTAGIAVGNVYTHAEAGGTLRLGQHLNADYGPPRISPNVAGSDHFSPIDDDRVGWYIFAGLAERYVKRDIFLDGNNRRTSHSVVKKKRVSDRQTGFAVLWQGVRLAYTLTKRSRQFKTQGKPQKFGALTMTVQF